MTNYETQRLETKQNWAIAHWCKQRNIPLDVVETHPQIKDIAFLLEFRDEFEKEYNTDKKLMATYRAFWKMVYSEKKSLRPKAFVKLEQLAHNCLKIRDQRRLKIEKIKSLRQQSGTTQK